MPKPRRKDRDIPGKEHNIFPLAFFISIGLHIALFFNYNISRYVERSMEWDKDRIEVNYYTERERQETKSIVAPQGPISEIADIDMPEDKSGVRDVGKEPKNKGKDGLVRQSKSKGERGLHKEEGKKEDVPEEERGVFRGVMPDMPREWEDSVEFSEYYRQIRNLIQNYAINNPPVYFSQGEVYLSFILKKEGVLKKLWVVEEKTTGDWFLCDAAIDAIKSSSPFPAFPQGLDEEEITFNIIISFEIDK